MKAFFTIGVDFKNADLDLISEKLEKIKDNPDAVFSFLGGKGIVSENGEVNEIAIEELINIIFPDEPDDPDQDIWSAVRSFQLENGIVIYTKLSMDMEE